jgi:Uma2 family endonuclease
MLVEVLMEFLLKNKIGRLFTDNTGYDLPDGSTVIPDLSCVAADRLLPVMITGNQYIASDLAIEVVSPSNTPEELSDKVNAYVSAGVKLVWVVYPRTRSVDVYSAQADGQPRYRKLNGTDPLSGEEVLPSFSVPVNTLFPPITP